MTEADKKTGQWETLKKVFRRLGKYRIFVLISLILAAVSVALTLYVPKLAGYAVDYIVGPGKVDFPGVFGVLEEAGNASPFSIEIEFTQAGPKNLAEIDQAVQDSADYLRAHGFEL